MCKLIGLGGVARSGKDSFCKYGIEFFANIGKSAVRISFADSLKDDLRSFICKKFKIDLYNCTPEEKEFVRPLLVAYGGCLRKRSKGMHFINAIKRKIKKIKSDFLILTDVRYGEYQFDEVDFVKQENFGKLIHIERYTEIDGRKDYIGPANTDEKINDCKIKEASDFRFEWKTSENETYIKGEVWNFLNKYYEKF